MEEVLEVDLVLTERGCLGCLDLTNLSWGVCLGGSACSGWGRT